MPTAEGVVCRYWNDFVSCENSNSNSCQLPVYSDWSLDTPQIFREFRELTILEVFTQDVESTRNRKLLIDEHDAIRLLGSAQRTPPLPHRPRKIATASLLSKEVVRALKLAEL